MRLVLQPPIVMLFMPSSVGTATAGNVSLLPAFVAPAYNRLNFHSCLFLRVSRVPLPMALSSPGRLQPELAASC